MTEHLPFEVRRSALGTEVPGSHRVTVSASSSDTLDELADLLEALCACSRFGCFVDSDTADPGVKIDTDAGVSEGQWTGTLRGGGLHSSFWRVFLQLCVQYHRCIAPVTSVDIPADPQAVLASSYLAPTRDDLVEVRRDHVTSGSQTVIRLDSKGWTPETRAQVATAFEDWGSIVYCGGFVPVDERLDETPFDDLTVSRVGPERLECILAGWRSTKAALDSAMDLCIGIHRFVQPLESIEVE